MKGVTIGGIKLNNLRYVDNIALLWFCPTDLQELINAVNKGGKPYRMEMNIIKTKAVAVSKTTPTPKSTLHLKINLTIYSFEHHWKENLHNKQTT